MFRALALLCLIAAPVLGEWGGGLKVRFGIFNAFIDLPQTNTTASSEGWILKERPEGPSSLASLTLMCPSDDSAVGVLYDDTGYVAGIQIALDVDNFSDNCYDMTEQGFTIWITTNEQNETKTYWTIQQYFISEESLATDVNTRIAKRQNSSSPILDDGIWIPANGTLYRIPTNVTELAAENSDFTLQACIPWMGTHYYYKMNNSTECSAKTILPFFPLVDDNQLIGLGFLTTGKLTIEDGKRNWFENPTKAVIQSIVTDGPECLYEMGDSPGVLTMHTYFIEHPRHITCINLDFFL